MWPALGLHGWALVLAVKKGQSLPMGWVWLGALLYKMGKVTQATTQNTTTTHSNHHELPPPYSPGALPSLSPWVKQAAPTNHGASAPLHHMQAKSRRACARCQWFACFGGQNERHQKIERGGSALALGDPCLINYTQQWDNSWRWRWMGSWGRPATGVERVGRCRIFALVVELIDKN